MLFKGEPTSSVPTVSAEAAQLADPRPADSVDVSAAEPIDVPEQAPQANKETPENEPPTPQLSKDPTGDRGGAVDLVG